MTPEERKRDLEIIRSLFLRRCKEIGEMQISILDMTPHDMFYPDVNSNDPEIGYYESRVFDHHDEVKKLYEVITSLSQHLDYLKEHVLDAPYDQKEIDKLIAMRKHRSPSYQP